MLDPFKNDSQLIERFRRGDEPALDHVYRAFIQPLRNFVLRGFAFKSDGRDLYFRGVWTEHDLEDIVQETFRRAFGFKARQSYDGVRPYKNYLFTIARNAVINDMIARNRQIPVGDALTRDAPSEDMAPLQSWLISQRSVLSTDTNPTSEERVENLEIYGLIQAFVESLEIEEAAFFELRFLSSLSQEKTARRMGWNRAKVRKVEARLRRAFLYHAEGTGYLDNRSECRVVRKSANPRAAKATFARARAIWRERDALMSNEILQEAAAA